MRSITVNTSTPYVVQIERGLLARVGEKISAASSPCRAMIVTDSRVNSLYTDELAASLDRSKIPHSVFVFGEGEESKRLSTVEELLERLAEEQFSRKDIIISLGGGVAGDIAGFAASVYARGISYFQVPTTLLSAIDASVGGKTGVDLAGGKNLCGSFWQPKAVFIDADTLKTLDEGDFKDGLAEMLKYAVLSGRELFEMVKNYESFDLEELIARCVEIKSRIVEADENDRGARQKLNLGHTVGHAIEVASGYKISHGSAVAIGLAIIARAAEQNGMAREGLGEEITNALAALGLPTATNIDGKLLAAHTFTDKKAEGSLLNLIIPKDIGRISTLSVPKDNIYSWIVKGL